MAKLIRSISIPRPKTSVADTDTLVEFLELLVALDTVYVSTARNWLIGNDGLPLLLADTGVHSDTGEVALAQQTCPARCTQCALDEDDDLVELEVVEQIIELAVLLALAELDVVLLKTVEGELGLIIDVNLERVPHELLADGTDLLGESGAEHHHLLLGGSGTEDLLNIAAHV